MLTLPRGQVQFFSPEPFPTFLAELDSEKVSNIMVIGDSFTMHFFPPLVLANRAGSSGRAT